MDGMLTFHSPRKVAIFWLGHLQEFESVEHFKQELLDYLNYYSRIKAKQKGLSSAIHRQQALSAA